MVYSNFLQYGASFGYVSRVIQKSCNIQMRGKSDDTPKKFTKSNLPSKDCIVCNRPFEWRKKWERCWDEVKYCSERCRREGKGGGGGGKEDSTGSSSSRMKFEAEYIQPTYRYNPSDNYIANIFNAAVALPPISIQQQEMSMYNKNIKSFLGLATAIIGLSAAEISMKPSVAHAAGTTRPSKKEIAEMFLDGDWESKATVLRKSSFRRLDEKPDSEYYVNPRFVEHIDEKAVAALLSFHTKQLDEMSNRIYQKSRKLDILDLCSSWTSHLPLSDYPDRTAAAVSQVNDVVGLGMNSAELDRNTQLSRRVVQDLNISPILPFESSSFDAILLQLSIGMYALSLQSQQYLFWILSFHLPVRNDINFVYNLRFYVLT